MVALVIDSCSGRRAAARLPVDLLMWRSMQAPGVDAMSSTVATTTAVALLRSAALPPFSPVTTTTLQPAVQTAAGAAPATAAPTAEVRGALREKAMSGRRLQYAAAQKPFAELHREIGGGAMQTQSGTAAVFLSFTKRYASHHPPCMSCRISSVTDCETPSVAAGVFCGAASQRPSVASLLRQRLTAGQILARALTSGASRRGWTPGVRLANAAGSRLAAGAVPCTVPKWKYSCCPEQRAAIMKTFPPRPLSRIAAGAATAPPPTLLRAAVAATAPEKKQTAWTSAKEGRAICKLSSTANNRTTAEERRPPGTPRAAQDQQERTFSSTATATAVSKRTARRETLISTNPAKGCLIGRRTSQAELCPAPNDGVHVEIGGVPRRVRHYSSYNNGTQQIWGNSCEIHCNTAVRTSCNRAEGEYYEPHRVIRSRIDGGTSCNRVGSACRIAPGCPRAYTRSFHNVGVTCKAGVSSNTDSSTCSLRTIESSARFQEKFGRDTSSCRSNVSNLPQGWGEGHGGYGSSSVSLSKSNNSSNVSSSSTVSSRSRTSSSGRVNCSSSVSSVRWEFDWETVSKAAIRRVQGCGTIAWLAGSCRPLANCVSSRVVRPTVSLDTANAASPAGIAVSTASIFSRAVGAVICATGIILRDSVGCHASAAVYRTASIKSSSSSSSWNLFVVATSLASFLAAATEAQRRRRSIAACESSTPGSSHPSGSSISSTPGCNSNGSVPASSVSSIFSGWRPSWLLGQKKGGNSKQGDMELLPLQQQQEVRKQERKKQQTDLSFSGTHVRLLSEKASSSPVAVDNGRSSGKDVGKREGPQLCWLGRAVGSYAEAANALLEDRSLAVVLPLDGGNKEVLSDSSSTCGESRTKKSLYGSGGGDSDSKSAPLAETGEPEAHQELLAKAALVFPDEIKRKQRKDDSWRVLRPSSPLPDAYTAASASYNSPYDVHIPMGVATSEQKGSSVALQEGDVTRTTSTSCLLTAVIDGHGGPQVAEYVRQHLPRYVHRELLQATQAETLPSDSNKERDATQALTDSALSKAVTQAFRSLDDDIFDSVRAAYALSLTRSIRVGACCTAVLLVGNRLLVANSGDCKAILSRRGGSEVSALNEQLNANSPAERQRLRNEHPGEENVVICKHSWEEQRRPSSAVEVPLYYAGLLGKTTQYSACYVKGRLQPTRAFGDFLLKKPEYAHELRQRSRRSASNKAETDHQQHLSYPYLTVDPVISTAELQGDEDFIVLGSDGLWDFLSDADVSRIVHGSLARSRQQATVTQATNETTSLPYAGEARPKAGTPGNRAEYAMEAAQTAAAEIVKEVLQKAANEHNMTPEKMKACEPKRRRHFYDDVTAVVVLLGDELKADGIAAPQSKL